MYEAACFWQKKEVHQENARLLHARVQEDQKQHDVNKEFSFGQD